ISKDVAGDHFLISKGKKDGVSKEQPVITSEKVLCGKIKEVYDDYSKVMFISSDESIFSAKLEGENIEASAKGQGEDKLKLDLISKEVEVDEGDMVYTSQLGGLYPEGLLVGTIKNIDSYDLKPYKEAEVKSDCQIGYLNNLFILKHSEPEID
ncbi:MAG: rod shape-determining protein MreC, partial [Minisyncoccales bacterium]